MFWILLFIKFCTFWRLKFRKSTKSREPKMARVAFLELLDPSKLVSRKIWVTKKSWHFITLSMWLCTQCENSKNLLSIYSNFLQYLYWKQMSKAATLIQTKYRRYCEHKRFKKSQEAATCIQNYYRTYKEHQGQSGSRSRESTPSAGIKWVHAFFKMSARATADVY